MPFVQRSIHQAAANDVALLNPQSTIVGARGGVGPTQLACPRSLPEIHHTPFIILARRTPGATLMTCTLGLGRALSLTITATGRPYR